MPAAPGTGAIANDTRAPLSAVSRLVDWISAYAGALTISTSGLSSGGPETICVVTLVLSAGVSYREMPSLTDLAGISCLTSLLSDVACSTTSSTLVFSALADMRRASFGEVVTLFAPGCSISSGPEGFSSMIPTSALVSMPCD